MRKIITIAKIVWLEMLRKKDLYVLLILLSAMLCALVSLNVFGVGGTVRYVKDVGLIMSWALGWILAVTVSCREIPQEERSGTIYPLLAKPLSRFEFVVGKWIGTWSITGAALSFFYLLTMLVVAMKGGIFSMGAIVQGFTLHFVAIGIITSIGILLSARMNSDAATSMTYVLTIASFLVTPKVPAFMAHSHGLHSLLLDVLYHMLPHFEILDMRMRIVHNYGPIPAGTFVMAILYGLLMSSVFTLLAWVSYRHKRFSRSEMYR